MHDQIDPYYLNYSGWTRFGAPRLKEPGQRCSLKIHRRPVDLEKVHTFTRGIKLRYRIGDRQSYRLLEMKRYREILQMPINRKAMLADTIEEAFAK